MPATELCQCGHSIATHPIWRGICVDCGYTRVPSGQTIPNGSCVGWDPGGPSADIEGNPLPDPDEQAPRSDFDPPDLDQAIQAATNALDALHTVAGTAGWRWMRPRDVVRIAVEAAAPHLHGDLRQRLDQAHRNTTQARHIFGAGGCWCGYNQQVYQTGGLNHLQAAAARDLLIAADRMRDRWAEGDDAVKQHLWQDLHTKADALRVALDVAAGTATTDGDP